MSDVSQEVYHCPSCGALAAVEGEAEGAKVCGECGFEFGQPVRISPRSSLQPARSSGGFVQRNVSSRRRISDRVEAVLPAEMLPTTDPESLPAGGSGQGRTELVSENGRKRVKRRHRKRKRTKMAPLLFLCVWAMVVMLVVIVVRNESLKRDRLLQNPREMADLELRIKRAKAADLLEKEFSKCGVAFRDFLAAHTSAERAQYVRDSKRLAATISAYYAVNIPWSVPEGNRLVVKETNLFIRGNRSAIEAIWRLAERTEEQKRDLEKEKNAAPEEEKNNEGSESGAEGVDKEETTTEERELTERVPWEGQPDVEVAFVMQGGRWVLDWEGFVRYSTESWDRFLNRSGDSKGVFRLYMREGRKIQSNGQSFHQVRFYPARNDDLLWNQKSEWVEVPVDSENGQQIDAILARAQREEEKEPVFGESIFGRQDPEKLHRVRVALEWVDTSEGSSDLVLRAVLAGNWYGERFEEDFEVEVPGAPEEEKGEPDHAPGDEKPGDGASDKDPRRLLKNSATPRHQGI